MAAVVVVNCKVSKEWEEEEEGEGEGECHAYLTCRVTTELVVVVSTILATPTGAGPHWQLQACTISRLKLTPRILPSPMHRPIVGPTTVDLCLQGALARSPRLAPDQASLRWMNFPP